MKKGLSVFLVTILVLCMFNNVSYASSAGISMDGNFSDWSNIPSNDLSGNAYYSNASMVYDDTYIYLYVVENTSEQWDTWYPTINLNVDGTSKSIKVSRTDYSGSDGTFGLNVQNSWSGAINNASGKVTRADGVNQWEIKIPIRTVFTSNGDDGSAYNDVPYDASSVSASWSDGGSVSLTALDYGNNVANDTGEVTTEEGQSSSEVTTEATEDIIEASTEDPVPSGSFAIDGYYDDWANIPKTLISYGSHNADGSINEYHQGAIIMSGEYVYVHVRMSDLYLQQIPVNELYLSINGIDKAFNIWGCNSDGSIDWANGAYGLSNGIHTGYGIFYRDGGNISLGEAAVTVLEGSPNDAFEFRMKISDLEQLYGLPEGTISNGAKLEFYSPNIGPDKVTTVGTSTGTYVGIIICMISVCSVYYYRKRKKMVA